MKVIIVNGNENNDHIKYSFISKLEEELDKDNLVIKVDYRDTTTTDTGDMELLEESYKEDDFDVYIFVPFHKQTEEVHVNTIKSHGVKETDILFIDPTNVAINIAEAINFLKN